jgi:hypothetical protein
MVRPRRIGNDLAAMGRVARLGSEWHKWPAGRRFLLNLQMTDLARVKLAVLKAGTEGEIDATFASLVNCKPARSSSTPMRSW